jgi:hypothetical protein
MFLGFDSVGRRATANRRLGMSAILERDQPWAELGDDGTVCTRQPGCRDQPISASHLAGTT